MSTRIVVPELGESVVSAVVARWLKEDGEAVAAGEAVVELETEKVNLEVAAEAAGVLAIAKPAGLHTVGGRCADSAQALLETLDPAFARVREASGNRAKVPAGRMCSAGNPCNPWKRYI